MWRRVRPSSLCLPASCTSSPPEEPATIPRGWNSGIRSVVGQDREWRESNAYDYVVSSALRRVQLSDGGSSRGVSTSDNALQSSGRMPVQHPLPVVAINHQYLDLATGTACPGLRSSGSASGTTDIRRHQQLSAPARLSRIGYQQLLCNGSPRHEYQGLDLRFVQIQARHGSRLHRNRMALRRAMSLPEYIYTHDGKDILDMLASSSHSDFPETYF